MPLFEVAVIETPQKKKGKEKLVLAPSCVIARDEQQAAMNTVLDNSDKLESIDRDYMEVLVRPFI